MGAGQGREGVVTARDLDVLRDLYKYRYLSVSQIQRLHFPSLQTAYRRLRALSALKCIAGFTARLAVVAAPVDVSLVDAPPLPSVPELPPLPGPHASSTITAIERVRISGSLAAPPTNTCDRISWISSPRIPTPTRRTHRGPRLPALPPPTPG